MGTQAAARTGTQNERYDLVSVLYHTLQEAETLETYIHDAQQGGDDELANFLRSVQEEDRNRAEKAKQLLAGRLAGAGS